MQIQINTDNHIEGGNELTQQVEAILEGALGRFSERITRVEVHLTDENSSAKGGGDDKRCVLEARLTGMQPVKVSDQGSSISHAVQGATDKMKTLLGRTLDRLADTRGRTSYGGDQNI